MSPMAGNSVMDLLLGKVAPTKQGTASVPGIGQPVDGDFANILDMLFGNMNGVAEDANAGNSNGSPLELLFAENAKSVSEDVTQSLAKIADANLSGAQGNTAPIIVAGLAIPEPAAKAVNFNAIAQSRTANSDESQQPINSMLLPKEAVIPNPQVLALLNQVPAELPTGKFAVLSFKVNDGTLRMEVASAETPNQKITLSFPTAFLNQTNNPQSNPASTAVGISGQLTAGNRVPLADPMGSTERFDQLLSKVNVKEIEISASQTVIPSDKSANQVTVTLAGESHGKSLLFSGKVNKNMLTATTQRRLTGLKSESTGNESVVDVAGDEMRLSKSEANESQIAITGSDKESLYDSLTKVFEKSDNISPRLSGNESVSVLTREARQARSASAVPVDRPAVKLTLRQELPNLAQLEGRTLMIKLEPEFLGPARLHLTMRQETLTARVMVDTPQAKAAVESSLSQLTDQLSKVGIKLDYIDVGVRGGGAQNQFFHNQSNWFRAHNSRVAAPKEIEPVSPAITAATVARQSAGFIAGDRVNIYA